MAKPRITIVGLGLIGTSLGLALRRVRGEFELVGHDRNPDASAAAKRRGAVDRTEWNLPRACEGASLIIFAIPFGEIRESLEVIAPDLQPGAVITDTANLKAPVQAWADEILPPEVSFIGGDPIIHAPAQGVEGATPDLFRDALYCLTSSSKASDEALRLVTNMVVELGAKPLFVDAAEHDGLLAGVDHLPFIMAAALLNVAAGSPAWREMRRLAGDNFQAATQVSAEVAAPLRDLCLHNKDNLLRWIDAYLAALSDWKEAIRLADAQRLEEAFAEAIATRQKWLRDKAQGQWEVGDSVPMPQVSGSLRTMLLGRLGERRR